MIKKLPKRKLVTRRELANLLDVTMSGVAKWEQAGMPVFKPGRKGIPSLYFVTDVKRWLDAREKKARESGTYDVARERARKEKAQAVLAEQTFAIRGGDLVPRDQVEKVWAAEVTAVRAKLLSWPATISDRLYREATLNGLPGVERTIKAAVDELLLELSKPTPKKPRPVKAPAKKRRKSGRWKK